MKNIINSPEFQSFKLNLASIIDAAPEIFLPIFNRLYNQEITLSPAEQAELDKVLEEIKDPKNLHGPFDNAEDAIGFLHRKRDDN